MVLLAFLPVAEWHHIPKLLDRPVPPVLPPIVSPISEAEERIGIFTYLPVVAATACCPLKKSIEKDDFPIAGSSLSW
jgi:hypothetical protein